jgi:hypothetical protein
VKRYVILTNRKRAVIALAHTVAFWAVALTGFITVVRPLRAGAAVGSWILAAVYLLVTAVLLGLGAASRHAVERLYFGLCATSAAFGLLRQAAGDPPMRPAVYVRVAMLGCAVAVGIWILRDHGSRRA